ncbi:hypothetical protein PILCRDRAFT_816947 [Piloderma croceum F 1598]|uniref:D-lactate dehydratase n=1 Tax=Piloderma croceum (strain F 1598) TaxID=765440 RepID=A0A0C3G530_PILCF|nr:hypothetical protein PILCRDRAFT_816947 [Piloderma croceum F 1598]
MAISTITYDTLVRAGISCVSAYVTSSLPAARDSNVSPKMLVCKGSRGIRILPDASFPQTKCSSGEKYDILVIPGGAQGAATISKSEAVQDLVREFIKEDKIVGMICAGSLTALTSKLPHQPLTSHPSVKSELEKHFAYSEDAVVVSGKLVTSRGPGTTFPFALTLISMLLGPEKRKEVAGPMCFPEGTPW